MNIHRNNYEEYFLLYADGELSQEDKQAVEGFVLNHPDLAEELQIFVDTKLTPSPHTMPHKFNLLKLETWDAGQLTDAQSAMLSALDGELNPEELATLEAQMSHDELLRKEWSFMTGLTLNPEPMAMPAKANLVRLSPWNEEAPTDLQQAMLAKLEGQLPAEADARLSESLAHDIELQKEWTVLQQTKLAAEHIVMPGKERLLRREKDDKVPVIKLGLKRWLAAAAIVTGIGWFVIDTMQSQAPMAPEVAAIIPAETKTSPSANEVTTPSILKESQKTEDNVAAAEQDNGKNEAALAVNNSQPANKSNNEVVDLRPAAATDKEPALIASNIQPENTLPSLTETTSLEAGTGRNTAELLDNPADLSTKGMKNPVRNELKKAAASNDALASYASYQDAGYEEEETINIAGAKLPKQKIRGIMRTVSRTIGRSFDKGNVAPAETSFVSELK